MYYEEVVLQYVDSISLASEWGPVMDCSEDTY